MMNEPTNAKWDSLGRPIFLCWLCNKRLQHARDQVSLIFQSFTLPNGVEVKMHKVCAADFRKNPDTYGSP
jgi:hypothetical protein